MDDKPVEPTQLLVELWARFRIPIWQIQAANQDAVDGGFDIATLTVARIAWKPAARLLDFDPCGSEPDPKASGGWG